jgi:hypothetical protein
MPKSFACKHKFYKNSLEQPRYRTLGKPMVHINQERKVQELTSIEVQIEREKKTDGLELFPKASDAGSDLRIEIFQLIIRF